MRPKIVFALLLAGLAGFAGIFFLKKLAAPQPSAAPAIQTTAATSPPEIKVVAPEIPAVPAPANKIAPANPPAIVPPIAVGMAASADEHEAYVRAHIDRLQDLQTQDDAASLQAILSELTNSDKTVRAAAVESSIQFGNRDAIPVLKDLAARTTDPAEKKQMLDAADFLALPTLTELRAQKSDK
jgi:type IV secretory pathway VirB10-like protein